MSLASAIYRGPVSHRRLKPKPHALKYRVFQLLVDLDELPALDRASTLFGHNRAALISFHDRDHGDRSGAPLRPQMEARLRAAGVELDGGPIRLLTLPRVLGYVFNPISIYFCHRPDGALAAIVHEVNNTFGEGHLYVLPVRDAAAHPVRQSAPKRLHVSPFMDMGLTYDFQIEPPGEAVRIGIHVRDDEGLLLTAGFSGERRAFSTAELLSAWLAHPLLTIKVIAGIHWEALWIWLKGVKYRRRPAPPREAATVARTV